jgi:hypothetical protein
MTLGRLVALAQIALGSVALAAPRTAVGATARVGTPVPAWVVRCLGARMVLEGALLRRNHSKRALLVGAGVDVVHGASMIVVARRSSGYRRIAQAAAVLAGASALLELVGRP